LSPRICTGLPRKRLGKLIAELAGPWQAQQESLGRRGHTRRRAVGTGPDHELVNFHLRGRLYTLAPVTASDRLDSEVTWKTWTAT
jgi:hypothetical protein